MAQMAKIATAAARIKAEAAETAHRGACLVHNLQCLGRVFVKQEGEADKGREEI